MRRLSLGTCGLLMMSAGFGYAQFLAESTAAMGVADTLGATQGAPAGGQVALDRARAVSQQAAPGAAPGVSNPGAGFAPAPSAGMPTLPGAPPAGVPAYPGAATPVPAAAAAFPGLSGGTASPGAVPTVPGFEGDPAATGGAPGQPGQPAVATPTPEPTIKVLIGKRVFDAVTGALLEDAYQQTVRQSEQDKYADDGQHDNGIQGDGIRGNVTTIKDKYVGAETNSIKNRLINMVRNSENFSPMVFYGFHVMAVDPTTQHRQMPNLLEKEAQRDETLRDWNNKFLADYRVDKNDPRSEFYQLYVPDPPMPPPYPLPPGYVAPQKVVPGQNPGAVVPGATPNIYNGDPVINVPGNEAAI